MSSASERTRRVYERIGRWYDLLDWPFERWRYRSLRPLLFRGLHGRILEAGVGTGRNIPFYPPGSEVVGIDLSPAMLERAKRRLRTSRARARVMEMDLSSLAFPDRSFDAAVASFVFCTLPDEVQLPALRELKRVIRPAGIVRLLDYKHSRRPARRAIGRLSEPWARWAFAARFDRRPELHFEEAGLVLTEERYVAGDLIRLIEARPTVSVARS